MPTPMLSTLQPVAPESVLPTMPVPPMAAPSPRKPRQGSIDSLLRDIPAQRPAPAAKTDIEMAEEPGPGIFMGLRVALLFNAGLGLAALVGYEAWIMLAR